MIDEGRTLDEGYDESEVEAGGWAWNAPYRAVGGMQRLRSLYARGLTA